MNLEALVNVHYNELNQNDKVLIRKILDFQDDYKNLSCEQMAKECHISRATLLRLCRKIGLSSFTDLKYMMKQNQKIRLTDKMYTFQEVCENYHLLINELEKISFKSVCEKIFNAETIYIYGTGNEQKSLALELKRIFLSVEKCVIDLFDYGEVELMRDSFQKDDLFIVISLSGETKEGVRILRMIRERIHTLSLTRLENNTMSSLSEDSLYAVTQMLEGIQYTPYELVGVFYALIDLLFVSYLDYRESRI